MKWKLLFRYVYTYYSFDEILDTDAIVQEVELDSDVRFTLHLQEDASFVASAPRDAGHGYFSVLTFPNKDNLVIREGEEYELAYDEFFDSMGDNNHNVYEGTVTLIRE